MTNQERMQLAKKFNEEKQSAAIDERQRQRLEFVNRMHQNKPSQVAIQPYNIKAVPADKTDLQPAKAEKQPEDNQLRDYSVNLKNVLNRQKQGQDTRLMQEYLAQGKQELDNAYYKKQIQELKANLLQQRSKYSDPVLAGNNIRSQVQATAYAQHKAEQERLKQLEKEYESYQYTNASGLEKQFNEKLEKIAGQLSKPIDEGARAALEELQAQTRKEYDAFHGSEAAKTYRYDQKTAIAKELLNTDEDVKKRIQLSYEVARGDYGIKDENGKEVSYNSFAAKQNKDYYYPLFEKKKQEAEEAKQWLSDKGYDVEALLDVYSSEQNAQQRKKVEEMQKDLARKNPALATVASWATNTLGALGAPEIGMHEPIKNTIKELQTGELHPVDPNSPYYNAIHATDTLRETVSEDMNGFERLLYQYGMSLADSLTTIPLDDFGLALMGNSSASRAALNVAENGGSATQALWTGAAAGAAEVLFEKVSLDQLKAFKKSNKTGLKEGIKNIAKGMFTEGSEEAATDVTNLVSDALINADNSDFSRTVQAYQNQGLSEEEAWKRAALDTVSNIGLDFVGGALSGAVLSAGATALNAADTARFGADIKKGRSDYSLEDLTEIGKTTNPQSRAYQLADKLIKRQEQGKRIGNYQAGALFRENLLNNGNFDHALRGISLKEVQSDLLDQGLQSGDDTQAYQLASLMKKKQEQGKVVTNRERVALEQAIDEAGAQDTALRKKLEADPAAFSAYLAEYKNVPENGAEVKNTAQGKTTLPTPETSVRGVYNAREKVKTKNAAGTLSTTVGYDKKLQHIQEIAGTEDGRVRVTLSTGKTVDLDRVAVASEETRAVYSMAANFDKAGANAFVDHYKGNLPKEYYADGFQAFYLAGKQGRSLEAFSERFPQIISVMGQESVAAAYRAGVSDQAALLQTRQENAARFKTEGASRMGLFQVDADKKKLTGDMKAQLQILQGLSDHYGVNIRVVDSKSSEGGGFPKQANGIYRGNGNIVVDINADAGAVAAVAFHEVGHYISEHNPEGFKVLSDFAVQYLEKQEGYDINERITALQKATREQTGRWISEMDALEEIACNSLSSIASDSGTINAALRLNAKKRRTLSQVLRDFAQRLKEIFSDYARKNKEAARWKDSLEDIMELARLLEESADTAKKTEMPQSGAEPKFSLNPDFETQYDEWDRKDPLQHFKIGNTSEALRSIGVEKKDIVWDSSKIIKIRSKHPAMTDEVIKQVPNLLENPVVVMESKTVAGRLTMLGEVYNKNGTPVLAVLELHPIKDGVALDEFKLASAYGKEHAQRLIDTSTLLYVEPNKNRTDAWLKFTRLQLPVNNNQYGPINIISNSSSKSNTEIDRLKYSLRETAEFEGRLNEQEDQAVQKMDSLVARLFQETGKKQADIQALRSVGKKILKEYQSSYSLDTFVENYQKIFDYMANSNQADYSEAIRLCTGVAKAVLEKSETLDTSMRDRYADFLREMREERISLSDVQKEELSYSYGSYQAGRNRLMGRVVVSDNGIPLDSLWGELCLKYPELFDYDTDEAQQAFRLIEVFDSLKPQMKNEFEGNIDEAATELAYRLYEEYFSVPELKSETQEQNNRMFVLRAEFKKSLEEARQQYRQRYQQAQKQLEEEYRTKSLELNKDKQQAVIRAKAQAQAYYRKIYENTRTRNKESRERSEYKNKIERNAQELFRWITKPNKRNHVPQPLVGPITEFILSLDFVSPRLNKDGTAALINSTNKIQKWSDAFYELNNVLQGLKSNEQNGMNTAFLLHLDPELPVRLSRFISEYRGSKSINQMNAVQLKELYWITSAVKSAVVSANELHNNRLFQHVEQLGDTTIEQTAGKKEKLLTNGVLKAADDFFGLSQMDSFSYFERLGSAAYSVLEELRDGFDKHVLNLNTAIEFFQKAKGDLDISSWTGNKARKYTFQVAGGKITLTTGHIMGLYEEIKRKQAAFHIFGGGIRTYAIKENGIKPVRVTLGDVQKITAVLTAEQKQFADQLQQYFARECTRQGNEASMTLYGYEKFSDPHYYPIQIDKNSVATIKNDQQTQLWSVLNMGFTKEVAEEASNPIILNDIFDVFTKHVTEMSVYNAFSVPILDAMKWFNYRNTKGFSVKQGVERVYGKSGQQYFLKLIEDISGTRSPDFENNLLNHAVKAYKLSAVGFNLRVAIQQPTAYIRAACVIDPKYLAAGLSKKPDIALTNRYVPISLWKSWGFYDVNVGNSMKSVLTGVSTAYEKMTEMSMWLPGKADDVTWSIIFNACCAEIKDLRPDLTVNSDAFYKAAGKRMRDVVDRTQVVDTVFHKSHFMRNTNIFAKTAGAFMSETNKSYNLIRNAILNAVEGKDGKAVKNLIRTASVLLLTNFVTGLAQSIMDAFRDDDKDKEWAEKYIENILPNFWNNSNPLGYLPVLKDISDVVTSLFTQEAYYQNDSDMSTAAIIALIQSIKSWIKHSNGEGDKNIYALVSESVKAISKFGIPAGNILRELESFYAVVVPGGIIKSETDLMYRDMYRAVTEGDKERYAEIYNELLDKKGKSKKQIENGLADFLSSNSKDIDEAANHLASGEKDAYRKIVMDMKALGFKQDTVVMAVNKRMVKLQRVQREQSFLPPAQYDIYGANEKISSANEYDLLFDALINNTQEEYNQLYSVLLQGNKTASQIKSALSTRKEKLLRQYAAALKSGDSNKINQLEQQMVKAFGSKRAADAAVKRYMEKIYQ